MEIEEGVIRDRWALIRGWALIRINTVSDPRFKESPVSTLRSAMIPFYVIYVMFIPKFFFEPNSFCATY